MSGPRALLPLLMAALAACHTTPDDELAAERADALEPVTITGFECGDNCYLKFTRPGSDEEEAALCHAPACTPWAEWQALPADMVGQQARALIGTGAQVDGDGDVMTSDFPAVLELHF